MALKTNGGTKSTPRPQQKPTGVPTKKDGGALGHSDMMRLSQIREAYEELSGKLSDVNRQLAFAGIGIIWIFKITDDHSPIIPNELLEPVIFLIISLALDLCQSLIQTFTWYIYYLWKHYNNDDEEQIVHEPESFNCIPWLFLLFKVIALITAYIYLFIFLWERLFR